ncbi:MAG: ferrous iron transporter B [Butyricicoccaceae bacterium]
MQRALSLLIFLCAVFFDAGSAGGALLLTGVIAGSVLLTLAASRLLSAFFLRGLPSSFVLELPPYRAPQPGRVIVRSVLDRTVFVLGRAMIVAAPAGALIWLLANITVSGSSLYGSMTAFSRSVWALLRSGRSHSGGLSARLPGKRARHAAHRPRLSLRGHTCRCLRPALFSRPSACKRLDRLHRTLHTPVHHLPLAVLDDLPYSFQETRSVRYTLAAIALPTCFGLALCALVRLLCVPL